MERRIPRGEGRAGEGEAFLGDEALEAFVSCEMGSGPRSPLRWEPEAKVIGPISRGTSTSGIHIVTA